jgi:5-methyltetrahydropteroyltriglutamate--homocysteine methyltransferase
MRSADRLLTTHTGSLPRPEELRAADPENRETALRAAVRDVVQRQVRAGIDIVSDGEMSKPSYATYVAERASGFGGSGIGISGPQSDALDFPEWAAGLSAAVGKSLGTPACIGEIRRTDHECVHRDIENLQAAAKEAGAAAAFMTAASPGVITLFLENQYYPSHEAYLSALTDLMREEYGDPRSGTDAPDRLSGPRGRKARAVPPTRA